MFDISEDKMLFTKLWYQLGIVVENTKPVRNVKNMHTETDTINNIVQYCGPNKKKVDVSLSSTIRTIYLYIWKN